MDDQEGTPRTSSALALLGFGALTAGAAGLGGIATARGVKGWYRSLRKPPFNPPDAVFGPVWTGLYALMAVSAWRVWRHGRGPSRARALAWWGAQLGLNAGWSWLFFGARAKRAALVDLAGLAAAIGCYARAARESDRPAAWMMAPYLGWVAFAGLLNAEIVRRNP